jgi:hypothetical protein
MDEKQFKALLDYIDTRMGLVETGAMDRMKNIEFNKILSVCKNVALDAAFDRVKQEGE